MDINRVGRMGAGWTRLSGSLVCLVMGVALTPGAAGDEAQAPVHFAVKDVDGKSIGVPEAGRTTVLLFVLGGQAQGREGVAALSDAVGAAAAAASGDVRVVTVVEGSEAAAQVRQLVAEKHPWPIVLDVEHALSGKLNVHAYPTTVIVSPDGRRSGHVPGQPKAYAGKVEAYIAFAAARIDRTELERRLA